MATARRGLVSLVFRGPTGALGEGDRVIRVRARKILEDLEPAATFARFAPIVAKDVDHRQARRRKMFGKSIIRPHKEMREFADAWIVPDDQQGFHRSWGLSKNL